MIAGQKYKKRKINLCTSKYRMLHVIAKCVRLMLWFSILIHNDNPNCIVPYVFKSLVYVVFKSFFFN